MFRQALLLSVAAALVSLVTAAEARAWGAYHRGYTYHSPGGGFYHTGSTAAYGPYGEHTASRSYGYSPTTGAYHSGYGQTSGYAGSSYHYSSGYGGYGGYYGGYRGAYGGYGGYAGAYRRW
jgi:hypothetical protein